MLVVDGYNFLHQWKALAQADTAQGAITEAHSMQDAREAVVRALEVYSQCRGVRVVVVFDAMHNPLGGSRCEGMFTRERLQRTSCCRNSCSAPPQVHHARGGRRRVLVRLRG